VRGSSSRLASPARRGSNGKLAFDASAAGPWSVIPRQSNRATTRRADPITDDGTGRATVLVWESGTDGGCTYFNDGWLSFSGRSLEAELGDGWVTGVHPDDRDACRKAYTEAFAARRDFQLEYRLRRHDGTYRWVRNIGTPRWSPNGSFLGYVGCALDVTQGRHLPLLVMAQVRHNENQAQSTYPGNLQVELSSFVGRASALESLMKLHASTRLLTLVGPAGVGKTRLALELARLLQAEHPDGVWVVGLASRADPAHVGAAVAAVLQIHESSQHDWVQTLTVHLRSKRLLLILENCEHVHSACADLCAALLSACPELDILATSREDLHVDGEVVWRVQPLSLPEKSRTRTVRVEESEAVGLLAERISSKQAGFGITRGNADALARICEHLDGIPLAIELIAPYVVSLGVGPVARMLDSGFALSPVGRYTGLAHQRALRATLDWSHRLLTPDEQILFRRLAIFSGGWSLEASKTVCSDAGLSEDSVVDCLERLGAKSLVQTEVSEHVRHRLLDTVRAYALERLELASEMSTLKRRHAEYMLSLSERVPPEAQDPAHAASLKCEQEDLRAALTWSLESREVEMGLRLSSATYQLWQSSGQYAEGRAWIERFLTLAGQSLSRSRAWALGWLGQLLVLEAEYDRAETALRSALELHWSCDDHAGVALTRIMLGNTALNRGDLRRATALHAEAILRLQDLGSPAVLVALFYSSIAAMELGDMERALALASDCERRANASRQPLLAATAIGARAMIQARTGETGAATQQLVEALDMVRPMTDPTVAVLLLSELGHIMLDQQKTSEAYHAFQEATERAYAAGERLHLGRALEGFGRLLSSRHPDRAVRIAGAVDRLRHAVRAVPFPSDRKRLDGWLTITRRRLGKDAFENEWQYGQHLGIDEAVALAGSVQPSDNEIKSTTNLTRRERQVAALLARGLTNKGIGAELVISPATVGVHIEHILSKLGLHSRAQAAVWAVNGGLAASEK
jgi:PAS domain S-box-containing protein